MEGSWRSFAEVLVVFASSVPEAVALKLPNSNEHNNVRNLRRENTRNRVARDGKQGIKNSE